MSQHFIVEDDEPDPGKEIILQALSDHRQFESAATGGQWCACGEWSLKDGSYDEHLAQILLQAGAHACHPGTVVWKFDGGRGALLCAACREIVGYQP